MPHSYSAAYLVGALLFVPLWLGLYWRNSALRCEMLVMSGIFVAIGVPMELLLYTKDWWHPQTITGTTIGIEDIVYSIGNGGYMAVVYAAAFRARPMAAFRAWSWPIRVAPVVAIVVLPLTLFYGLGVHSFLATTAGSLVALVIVLTLRRDLWRVAALSALMGTLLAVPAYLVMEAVFPGVTAATWDLPRLSGVLVWGIPIEDLIWYLYTSALWSTYYKFATGQRLVAANLSPSLALALS